MKSVRIPDYPDTNPATSGHLSVNSFTAYRTVIDLEFSRKLPIVSDHVTHDRSEATLALVIICELENKEQ